MTSSFSLVGCALFACAASSIIEIPFVDGFRQVPEYVNATEEDNGTYETVKMFYEKNMPSNITPSDQPKIPKIFHQIWIGPKPVPVYLLRYQESLKKMHPDFEYHLWSEASLATLGLPDWDLVQKATNWGTKADIIKANLLDVFGGIVLDADVLVLRPFHDCVCRYDFVAGLEMPRSFISTNNRLWVGVSVIGSKPGHPVIQEWRKLIRSEWDESEQKFVETKAKVMNLTYYPFTRAVLGNLGKFGTTDIVFPPTYMHSHIPPADEAISLHDSAQEWLP